MSVQDIIAQLPKLSEEERELILRRLVNLDECFEPTPAMEDAIREGLRSLREEKTYSAAEVRARIAAWTARYSIPRQLWRTCRSSRHSSPPIADVAQRSANRL